MQGGLLGLVTVGDQTCQEVHLEVVEAAMACRLDLADILELVVDALDDRPLAQQQLIGVGQDPLAHVLAHFGDQQDALCREELLGECLGDVAAIAKELVPGYSYSILKRSCSAAPMPGT